MVDTDNPPDVNPSEEETSTIVHHNTDEDAPPAENSEMDPEGEQDDELLNDLPILPLRGMVVYPETIVPLLIGQSRSIRLVDDVATGERVIGLVTSQDPELEEPAPDDLYRIGTLVSIQRLFRAPDGTIRLLVQGMERIRVEEFTETEPYLRAHVARAPEEIETGLDIEALVRNIAEQFRRFSELVPSLPDEILTFVSNFEQPLQTAYTAATYLRMDLKDGQQILEIDNLTQKLRRLTALLGKELEVLELGRKIQDEAQSEIEKVQREFYLREQLKAIQRELGEGDEQQADAEEFRQKIEQAGMTAEAEKEALRELDRLSRLPSAAAEYGVIRNYLDWLTALPWSTGTDDNLDIAHARDVLNEDHYGLEDIKDRILEYLAVRKLRMERADEFAGQEMSDQIRRIREGVILCFVGPPGVGKTSLGASIARALGRKFIRLSLGGVRDEAEIRGHRRTYIGAMPGRIIQAIRRVESRNPVVMLDEIDKLGMDFRGDPSSALLEVLDPEQNTEFRDHYLDVAFDLSQVMFVTTANVLDTIPGPLRDRMEIIQLSGYTEKEKIQIAQQYLVPRQLRENGLRGEEVTFTDEAILKIIRDFTREAGVRSLEREVGACCRKVVTRIAAGELEHVVVDPDTVREFLGKPKYYYITEVEERTCLPGVVTGLVWTPVGGDVVFIEATQMSGSKGFLLTGQLGDVMQESARAALSYVRSNAEALNIDEGSFETHDIHLHVPAGAVPKDGPSAGITMATALASLLTRRLVRSDVAMTGEITLRGQVLPVGGIKEKILGAHRFGIGTVILPRRNEKDLEDVPEDIRSEMQFVLVDRVDEVFETALTEPKGEPQLADVKE